MLESKQENTLKKIKEKYNSLSKGHRRVADYILKNYEKAAFMTAMAIAEQAKVSEATVVRFASVLGFKGFPPFKKELQELIKTELTTLQRIDMVANRETGAIAKEILRSDVENIKHTIREIDENEFNHVVDAIIQARKIFIIGFRTSSLLSRYFGYYLNIISDQVIIIDHDGGDVYENLIKISPDDVIIGISFPRYSHKTNEILSYVQKKGGKIIAVTDNQKAPIVKHADHALIAKSNIITFVDTLVAPLSLLNALIVAIGYKRKDQTWETFKELEELWCEHDVYTGAKKYEEE